jgi:hypothetical protein
MGQTLDIVARMEAKPLKLLALPSEARDPNNTNALARYLGEFYLIVIQLVLAAFPKPFSGAVIRQ